MTLPVGMDLSWKSFKVSLKELHAWAQASAGPLYAGMSADTDLTLWFKSEPGPELRATIQAKWDGLTEEHEDAKHATEATRAAAVVAAKTAMLTSDMTKWSPSERKLFMGMHLTDADRDALVVKYPKK